MRNKILVLLKKINDFMIGQIDKYGTLVTGLFICCCVLAMSFIIIWRAGHNHAMKAKEFEISHQQAMNKVAELYSEIQTKTQALEEAELNIDRLKAIEFNTLVEPAIIKAIIMVESSNNPKAFNAPEGAVGLMQLRPIVYKKICGLTQEEAFNPRKNVACGSLYFKHLLNRFGGNLSAALHFYNSGSPKENGYAEKVAKKLCKGKKECLKQLQNN